MSIDKFNLKNDSILKLTRLEESFKWADTIIVKDNL